LSRKAVDNWAEKFFQGRSKDDEREVWNSLIQQSKDFYAVVSKQW
jgi:hypothetical protein